MSEKKRKKGNNSALTVMFVLYLIMFVAIFVLVCGISVIALNSERILNFIQKDSYRYQLGLDKLEDTVTTVVDESELYFDDKLYLSMDDISKLCDLTVTGDYTKRTYFPADDDSQYVTFFFSSDKIIINGETTTMSDSIIEKNGSIYVPASFFYNYSKGISITVDSEKYKITVSRISVGTEYNTLGEEKQVYEDISFMSGSSDELEHLNDNEVFANTVPLEPPSTDDGISDDQISDNTNPPADNTPDNSGVNANSTPDNSSADNTQNNSNSGSDSSPDNMLTDILG